MLRLVSRSAVKLNPFPLLQRGSYLPEPFEVSKYPISYPILFDVRSNWRIVVMSLHLPLETWDRIVDHLWNDWSSLDACSLTCTALLVSTRLHIFRNVQAHLHCEQDCDNLSELEAPHTTRPLRYIGMLNIGRSCFFHAEPSAEVQALWLDNKFPPLLSELLSVDTLRLFNVVWAMAVPRALEESPWSSWLRIYLALTPTARASVESLASQIRTLMLQTIWFGDHKMLQDFLVCFTGLVKLDLQDIVVGGPPKPGAPASEFTFVHQKKHEC